MLDMIFSQFADLFGNAMDLIMREFLKVFGMDMERFNQSFPFAGVSYGIFQQIALCVVLALAVIEISVFFRNGADKLSSTPMRTVVNAIAAVVCIYYGNYVLSELMRIGQNPYNALLYADTSVPAEFSLPTVMDFIADYFYQQSILLYLILLILLSFSLLKLLLEAVERYAVLGLLLYCSPLASSMLASTSTSGVFKRYLSMFVSQLFLMILNVWSFKMVISLFDNLPSNDQPLLSLLLGYAFLRLAQRLDSYFNQLGLNAAITGAGLGAELFAAGTAIAGKLTNAVGGMAGAASGSADGSGGGTLGVGGMFSRAFGAVSPHGMVGDAVQNTAGAFGGAVKSAVDAASESYTSSPANTSPMQRIQAATKAGVQNFSENMSANMHDAVLKTRQSSLIARALGQDETDRLVSAVTGNNTLTDQQRTDLGKHAFLADEAFNGFANDTATEDSSVVGAVMQGIGFDQLDTENGGFLRAGFGDENYSDINYKLDANGIEASYTKDGSVHTASILNKAQYDALSQDEQYGYQSFHSASGNPYYCKTDKMRAERPPTDREVSASTFQANVAAFTSSPSENPLGKDDYAYMAKHPETVNTVMDGLAASQENITDARTVTSTLEAMRIKGVPEKERNAAVMAAESDNAMASMNGDGISVTYKTPTGTNQITVLTEAGASRYDAEYLENRGYARTNNNGRHYYSLFERNVGEIRNAQHQADNQAE